jgi:hypothetical protein
LLQRAQQCFVSDRGGKQDLPLLRLNGKEHIRIETIHGSFEFAEQRFLLPDGSGCRYLKRTGWGLRSSGIEEFCLYYCNRLSFAEVSKLLERVSGENVYSASRRCGTGCSRRRVRSAALCLSEVSASKRSLALPTFAEAVDIYDADSEEVLVSTDAIQVKAQKPTRERRRDADDTPRKEEKKKEKVKKKRIETDLMLVQGRDGSFRHLSAGLVGEEGMVSLCEVARAYLRREWGENTKPLPPSWRSPTERARFA